MCWFFWPFCHADQCCLRRAIPGYFSITWRQSHHAQAMQQANASTVLGNFRNARFAKDGLISCFYLKDEKHYVRTDGPDGKFNDYPVAYTFGIFPLQQYLVPFPNGHLQSLAFAWDSRSQQQGWASRAHPAQVPGSQQARAHWVCCDERVSAVQKG